MSKKHGTLGREYNIMLLWDMGLGGDEIAERLNLGKQSVYKILRKNRDRGILTIDEYTAYKEKMRHKEEE